MLRTKMAFTSWGKAGSVWRSRQHIPSAPKIDVRGRIAPIVEEVRRWGGTLLAIAAGMCIVWSASAQSAPPPMQQQVFFDIPRQPLARALQKFSAATGIDVLMDTRNAGADAQSLDVKGPMEARDALDTLLIGSGLAAREFDPDTVLVGAAAKAEGGTPIFSGPEQIYFAVVQSAIEAALCAHSETAPGRYRLAMALWIGKSGRVVHFKRLDTTGEASRDVAVDEVMRVVAFDRLPPAGLPQPLTLVIAPREQSGADGCRLAARTQRGASMH